MAIRKAKASKQPTKTLARKYLVQVESRIASGKVGIKEAKPSPRCKALMTTWSEGLTNRYAKGDQGRAPKAPHPGLRKVHRRARGPRKDHAVA